MFFFSYQIIITQVLVLSKFMSNNRHKSLFSIKVYTLAYTCKCFFSGAETVLWSLSNDGSMTHMYLPSYMSELLIWIILLNVHFGFCLSNVYTFFFVKESNILQTKQLHWILYLTPDTGINKYCSAQKFRLKQISQLMPMRYNLRSCNPQFVCFQSIIIPYIVDISKQSTHGFRQLRTLSE